MHQQNNKYRSTYRQYVYFLSFCTKPTFVKKGNSACFGDTVNEREAGRRHNYLYIHSPGGAFSVIWFWRVVILWHFCLIALVERRSKRIYFGVSSVCVSNADTIKWIAYGKRHLCENCFTFLPRCMECRRGLAMRILSVCLSVCQSVKGVDCCKTEEKCVQILIPYERTFSLVF